MPNTPYTYTAQNPDKPDSPVSYTLDGDYLQIDLSALTKQMLPTEENPEGGAPLLAHYLDSLYKSIHVRDARIWLEGEKLNMAAWQRAGGLRLAPLQLTISQVADPAAARQFVTLVAARKASAHPVQRFPGLLDYWGGWIVLVVGAFALFRRLRKRGQA